MSMSNSEIATAKSIDGSDVYEMIVRRAEKIKRKEQDRCDFQIYCDMAIKELTEEGKLKYGTQC